MGAACPQEATADEPNQKGKSFQHQLPPNISKVSNYCHQHQNAHSRHVASKSTRMCVQADLKRLYYLWQIYHIKNEMSSAQSAAHEQFGELREAAVQLQATEKQIEQLRKQQAGFNKDALKQEHQMKRRRAEFEKQVLLLISMAPG